MTFLETPPALETPEQKLLRAEAIARFDAILKMLSLDGQRVLTNRLLFHEPVTYEALDKTLGLKRGQALTIEGQALRRLGHPKFAKMLREVLEPLLAQMSGLDMIRNESIPGSGKYDPYAVHAYMTSRTKEGKRNGTGN